MHKKLLTLSATAIAAAFALSGCGAGSGSSGTSAQGPEIETMTGWLKSWNEATHMPAGHTWTA